MCSTMRKQETPENKDEPLPDTSPRLLSPPLRLVSSAMWKVMLQRDVMHYGKLEEFVTSVSDTVPGLLTYRHRAKLTVGLQARLILEELRVSQAPDPELILPQLERLCAPTVSKGKRKDEKVEMAVKNFNTLVHTLLNSAAERKRFFQEEFEAQYGPCYDSALEKLLWEFLTRLDQLLPVPDLAQTVSWLSAAPAVLEERAHSATRPQLLTTLLQHEECLGHLDSASSFGDSIPSSLSLTPSGMLGHVDGSGSAPAPDMIPNPCPSTERSTRTLSQIAPVIGTISIEDLPQRTMGPGREEELEITEASGYTRVRSRSSPNRDLCEDAPEKEEFLGERLVTILSPTPTSGEEESSDEAQTQPVSRRKRGRVREKQETRSTREKEGLEDGRKKTRSSHEGQGLLSALSPYMKHQLRVIIPRLDVQDVPQFLVTRDRSTKSHTQHECKVRNGDSVKRKRKPSTPKKNMTGTADEQFYAESPCIPTIRPVRMDSSEKAPPLIESADVVIDSEDEAAEKVKGKLFTTHYCKTKNNTYVPTLHEFWSPVFLRRDHISPGNGSR